MIVAKVHHGYIWSPNCSDSTFMQEPYVSNLPCIVGPNKLKHLLSIVCVYVYYSSFFVTLQIQLWTPEASWYTSQ